MTLKSGIDIGHTFGKEATVARLCVPPQEPAVAEVVVTLNELDAVATGETELVGAPGLEFIYRREVRLSFRFFRSLSGMMIKGPTGQGQYSRTTTRRSPGRAFSVWVLAAMVAAEGGSGGWEESSREGGWKWTRQSPAVLVKLHHDAPAGMLALQLRCGAQTWRPLQDDSGTSLTRARGLGNEGAVGGLVGGSG